LQLLQTFVPIKHRRIFNVHLHADVEELRRRPVTPCSAICSHHKCKTSVRRVRVSVAWVPSYNVTLAKAYLHTTRHPDPCSRLARIDVGQKLGRAAVPLWVGGAGSPSDTMSLGPRSISVPSGNGILIHETVWPQYTRVTDERRQTDRQTTSHDNSRTLHCNGRLKNKETFK